MSSGLSHIDLEVLSGSQQLGKDGKDGVTYMHSLKKKYVGEYEGQPFSVPRGRSIAVKTFKAKKSVAKILKEAELQSICASAGISPQVYGVNVHDKYIAMEMMVGLPAEDYRGGVMPDDQQYMICALMGRLDSAGILHGDMNALNVMLCSKGRPYMIDFGFAKKIKSMRSKSNTMCGTPLYMAPELVRHQKYSEKVDVWSIGIITYQLLSGRTPFDGKNIKSINKNILYKFLMIRDLRLV